MKNRQHPLALRDATLRVAPQGERLKETSHSDERVNKKTAHPEEATQAAVSKGERANITPEDIDTILPQTQCGLCGHGGCMPYAEAIVFEQAAINLCPPGGVKTLQKLGELTQQDPTPYTEDMQQKTKPPSLAVIREAECIGCTKCIQACPVDAILGSAKHMHTIITDACTGCELCIPPCPVDCIDMLEQPNEMTEEKKAAAREHYQRREIRIKKEKEAKKIAQFSDSLIKKKHYIQEAIARAKAKKHTHHHN